MMTIQRFIGSRFQSRFAVLGADNAALGTLVLIHGLYENLSVWEGFAEEFAVSYRVVVLDALGHNPDAPLRDAPLRAEEHFTMQEMADEVLAILEHCGISEAVFAGHSMGGAIAMHCLRRDAERHTSWVRGLCLFHATPFADTEEGKRNREKAIESIKNGGKQEATESLLKRILAERVWVEMPDKAVWLRTILNQTSESGMIAAHEAMRDREDTTALLRDTPVPTLFILGKEDPIIDVQKMLPVAALPQTSLLCLLADVAHAGMMESPKKCAAALRGLMAMCQ
jgi:pimeloyl-ACP methyl ester carboxylesterase